MPPLRTPVVAQGLRPRAVKLELSNFSVSLLALRRRLSRGRNRERHVGSEHKGVVSNAVSTTASEWFPLCAPRGRRHYQGAPRSLAFPAREDRQPTVANRFCRDRLAACGLAGVRPRLVA